MKNEKKREKAILAGFRQQNAEEPDPIYEELALLADTSGADVADIITQPEMIPTARFYVGSGKVKEIAEAAQELEAGLVIFNHDLSPLQLRNLDKAIGVKVIDRTQLILDIFAMRAKSNDGKIQVELAQLEYLLPRILGKGIELSRLGGGIGTRGPGETKLETDRRRIRTRISTLKKKIKKIEVTRATQKNRRMKGRVPVVALVGYTNAGKTTLFNSLSGESAYVEDKLFATLDPLTRKIFLPPAGSALLVDTVGFIRNLPVNLVDAFKSTLEGIADATLLLHVVDVAGSEYSDQIKEVNQVVNSLGAGEIPVIMVFNKMDNLKKPERLTRLLKEYPGSAAVSALNGKGIDTLRERVAMALAEIKVQESEQAEKTRKEKAEREKISQR